MTTWEDSDATETCSPVRKCAPRGGPASKAVGRYWPACAGAFVAAALACSAASAAKPPGDEAWMIRMLVCQGQDATMELYLPQSVAGTFGGHNMRGGQTLIGYYALDLTSANKGKPLEPVQVTMSADKKSLTIDQYTRGLPPTHIPVAGGTVDFDQRFATAAKCGPFQAQDPNFGKESLPAKQ